MTKLTGLTAIAGALLAAALFTGASASVPGEVCKAEPVESLNPIIPAGDVEPAPVEQSKPKGCGEQTEAEKSPDAVCVYTPGKENERTPVQKTNTPQASTSDSGEGFIEQAATLAIQIWQVVSAAVRLAVGTAQL